MAYRRAHRPKVPRPKASMRRRLLVIGLAAGAAASQIYLANIPRTISLPEDDVDAQMAAKADNERIEIDEPAVPEGGLLLSYSGQAGEVADLHFENAIVDSSNARLQSSLKAVKPVPARIAYVSLPAAAAHATSPPADGDTCHTFVEVRRANGASPVTSLNAFLLNGSTNNEQRRELRVWTEGGGLEVEVHTDPPPSADGRDTPLDAVPGCSKMLEVRPLADSDSSSLVDAPLIQAPVRLVVPEVKAQKASSPASIFRIELTPASATPLKWLSADDRFAGISLGNTALESRQLRILPLYAETGERLKVTAEGNLVLDRLAFSLNTLSLRVSGPSAVEVNGKRLGFDFMRFLKQNPILAGVLGLLNGAIVLLVKETFLPRFGDEPDAADQG
jgi:hypothetical protein